MPVGDIYAISIHGRIEGQETVNQRYYVMGALTASEPSPQTIAAAFDSAISLNYKLAVSVNWTWEFSRLQKVFPLPVRDAIDSTNGAGAGTITGDSLPTTVAAVAKFSTGFAGRAKRGRIYFPGIAEASTLASFMTSGALVNFNQVASSLAAPFNAGSARFDPVVYNRTTHVSTLITGFVLRPLLGNQRRRRVGRGS